MPGLVAFNRRWSVGSDDLVVPALVLLIVHLSWLGVALVVGLGGTWSGNSGNAADRCGSFLRKIILSYSAILILSSILEAMLCVMSMRGSILDTEPRRNVKYVIYVRFGVMMLEIAWLSYATFWLVHNYQLCGEDGAKEATLGMVVCNWVVVGAVLLTGWCVFDSAGRSWVKMKKYQRSMRESESRFQYKRSGNLARNWRQRKVLRAYQDSWDHRCRLLFCCIRNSDRSKNSFTDIARLLSDFFRDLDVVPSDVVAGLVLLRKFQKLERETNVREHKDDTYQYLSGVPVTPRTKFLPLGDLRHYKHFEAVVHFMHYALAAYGWPMLLMTSPLSTYCQLGANLSCLCHTPERVEGDNCWSCNYAALKGMLAGRGEQVIIVYATYHVDVAQTPFFVAVDFSKSKVVVSIRGTLSMKDVITDLNAESETLPLNPPKEDWLGHKGMVEAAVYIKEKLEEENILRTAFEEAEKHKPGQTFGLVLVGHSLGAGTASILAILLRQAYPDLQCFAYSPPGGLLSMPAVQYTKSFITSIVLGKDVVPRIGLYQMESLRADLINAIKKSKEPKWKTIACSVTCCKTRGVNGSGPQNSTSNSTGEENERGVHPSDSTIALTLHRPLYPPGSIIHVVRHHPSKSEQVLKKRDPVYQAIWANNTDFDEVLISPVMIQDHMPDKVLEALNKVLTHYNTHKGYKSMQTIHEIVRTTRSIERTGVRDVISSLGPAKPQRTDNNGSTPEQWQLLNGSEGRKSSARVFMETSFTSADTDYYCASNNEPKWPQNSSMDWTLAPLASPEETSSLVSWTPGCSTSDSSPLLAALRFLVKTEANAPPETSHVSPDPSASLENLSLPAATGSLLEDIESVLGRSLR